MRAGRRTQASAQFFAALGVNAAFGRVWQTATMSGSPLTVVAATDSGNGGCTPTPARLAGRSSGRAAPTSSSRVAPTGFAFPALGECGASAARAPGAARTVLPAGLA